MNIYEKIGEFIVLLFIVVLFFIIGLIICPFVEILIQILIILIDFIEHYIVHLPGYLKSAIAQNKDSTLVNHYRFILLIVICVISIIVGMACYTILRMLIITDTD